jgi:hypothetical protein
VVLLGTAAVVVSQGFERCRILVLKAGVHSIQHSRLDRLGLAGEELHHPLHARYLIRENTYGSDNRFNPSQ